MGLRVNALAPCATYFAAGRVGGGVLALLLQLTVFGWPLAYHMARRIGQDHAVDRKLNELSAAYQVPAAMTLPRKRFGEPMPVERLERIL